MTDGNNDGIGHHAAHHKGKVDAPPPCSTCGHAQVCTVPDRCKPFMAYVAVGRWFEPPVDLPGSAI